MAYSTIPKGSLYMNTKLYTGDATTSHAITGVNFQPDMTWIKSRTSADTHALFDAVRGATKRIIPNNDTVEGTQSNGLTAFDSDGFTVSDAGIVNQNYNYASWNWKANGAGSANTDGSINSTVSVNDTAGFSIVSYVGNSTNSTVGHGLSTAPKMIIFKNLNDNASWRVAHDSIGWDKSLFLDNSNATQTEPTYFNSTAPTNQVFYLGTNGGANNSGDNIIAYCFADVQGYSKFGSYTGNGNTDGTFVYTGFKPAWVMVKKSSATNNWVMTDNKRDPFNDDATNYLLANDTGAAGTGLNFDFLSNGFKLRSNSGGTNTSSATYIYMAFAENPFVATSGTSAIPVTAR